MRIHSSQKGFTLIELSIVLVTIGLIVAGIMAGQSLIHSAQLRSVIVEVNGFKTAINTYKDYYDYLPGDHPTAKDYWPTECVDSGTNKCNGNGNGKFGTVLSSFERLRMWQHLSLSGMISGNYTGINSSSTYAGQGSSAGSAEFVYISGVVEQDNFPPSRLNGGRYTGAFWISTNRNGIVLGKEALSGGFNLLNSGVMTPSDAELIDRKMDDSLPGKGDVSSMQITGNFCLSGSSPNYTYKLSETSIKCVMFFAID